MGRSRPIRGQDPRAARTAQELAQPPKTANVEILGGQFARAQHGPDELPAAIHRPERGVIHRGLGLQLLELKRLALPGDGSLMVAHGPGPEEGRSCRNVPSIVRGGTRIDNRREWAGRAPGGVELGLRLRVIARSPGSRPLLLPTRRRPSNRTAVLPDLDPLAAHQNNCPSASPRRRPEILASRPTLLTRSAHRRDPWPCR